MAEKKGLFSRIRGVFGGVDEKNERDEHERQDDAEDQAFQAADVELRKAVEEVTAEAGVEAPAAASETSPNPSPPVPVAVPRPPAAKKPAAKKPAAKKPAAKKPAAKKPAAKKSAKKAEPKQAAKKVEPKKTAAKRFAAEVNIPEQSVDIRAVREGMDMTQAEFAKAFGFSIHTLRKWEQGVREPEKPTRILLMMIRDRPEVVKAYLKEISKP
jgi:DNA-binding transcriptional regulator YiaG